MGRREQIRGRLEAARRTRDAWVALMRSTALADLRDLLAVADAAAVVIRAIISQGAGPAAPIFDEFDAAVEAARGGWFKVDGEAIDSLRAALDRLDNGGDR